MNNKPSRSHKLADVSLTLARWCLGVAFIYMGLNKALHPVDFLKLVQQYELVQNFVLLNCIAAILPWLEIFCGFLLLAGIAVRGTALVLLLMLAMFTWLVFDRALNIMAVKAIPFCAVKFDCGCGTGEVFICHKLIENLGLIVLSAWLLFGYRKKYAPAINS
jgi:uncharacterized membrane protein YphA (DoxX/SURF4 family)